MLLCSRVFVVSSAGKSISVNQRLPYTFCSFFGRRCRKSFTIEAAVPPKCRKMPAKTGTPTSRHTTRPEWNSARLMGSLDPIILTPITSWDTKKGKNLSALKVTRLCFFFNTLSPMVYVTACAPEGTHLNPPSIPTRIFYTLKYQFLSRFFNS